jgi:hypothetical protein
MRRLFALILPALALVCLACLGERVRAQTRTAQEQLAITATGNTARAAEAMAARLRAAGLSESDVQVFTPVPRRRDRR